MKFERIKDLNENDFCRLTGIKRNVFKKMLEILKIAEKKKRKQGGRPNKVSLENRILMTLEYWREYRTYFHIGNDYGINESSCYRNICWIEDTLSKDKNFQLPGEKELLKEHFKDKSIIIDSTESPIQRPKKTKKSITLEKRKNTQ